MSEISPVRLAFNESTPDKGFDGDLSPVIFLHGLVSSKEDWGDLPKKVANATKRKVYAVDARNHGDSEWSENFNLDINVDDILHFMGDMGIKKAIIVGHCMGGITAIKAALKKPEKIEKIAVVDIGIKDVSDAVLAIGLMIVEFLQEALESVPPELDETEAKKLMMEYMETQIPKKANVEFVATMLKPSELEKLDRVMDQQLDNFAWKALKLHRKEDGKFGFKSNLPVIEKMLKNRESLMSPPQGMYYGPACFIYGDVSLFDIGAEECEIEEHFPNATFVSMENANHSVHLDVPEEFMEVLLNFLC